MNKKVLFFFAVFLVSSYWGWAQREHDLTPEEKEDLKTRIVEKLDDFQYDLQILAGKYGYSLSTKQARMKVTLNLFIGKGDQYLVREETRSGKYVERWEGPVTMSRIKSKYTGEKDTIPMRKYLESLIRQSQYCRIEITQADGVRVDSFHKVSDNRYVATAHILQGFVRYNSEGKRVYSDKTEKTVTIYIDRVSQMVGDHDIVSWDIQLGNVEAEEIW